jgi:hypothetical protein
MHGVHMGTGGPPRRARLERGARACWAWQLVTWGAPLRMHDMGGTSAHMEDRGMGVHLCGRGWSGCACMQCIWAPGCTSAGVAGPWSSSGFTSTRRRSSIAMRPRAVFANGSDVVNLVGPTPVLLRACT